MGLVSWVSALPLPGLYVKCSPVAFIHIVVNVAEPLRADVSLPSQDTASHDRDDQSSSDSSFFVFLVGVSSSESSPAPAASIASFSFLLGRPRFVPLPGVSPLLEATVLAPIFFIKS